jgi:hypothetical protein
VSSETSGPRCEVIVQWQPAPTSCDEPAVAWYPAYGGGRMDLCERHAAPHAGIVRQHPAHEGRTWRANGTSCLNCDRALTEHEGQRFCPQQVQAQIAGDNK